MGMFDAYNSVGPQINVKLFGDAAAQGVAVGNSLPTPLAAGVQGAEQGYKFVADQQQEQAKTEQIQTQTAGEQQQNQIRAMQLQTDQLNQDSQNQLVLQDTQNKLAVAKTTAQDLKNTDTITTAIANGDTKAVGAVFSDPNTVGTLSRNGALADKAARLVINDPTADPTAKAKAQAFQDLQKEAEYERANAELIKAKRESDLDPKYTDNLAKVSASIAGATGLTNNAPIPESDILQYSSAPNGYWHLNTDSTGKQSINTNVQPNTKANEEIAGLKLKQPYQLFKGNDLVGNFDEAQFKDFNEGKQEIIARRNSHGLYTSSPIQQQTQQTSTPQVNVPTFNGTPQPTPTAVPQVVAPPAPDGMSQDAWQQRYQAQVQQRSQVSDKKTAEVQVTPSAGIIANLKAKQQAANGGAVTPSVAVASTPTPTPVETIPPAPASLDAGSSSPKARVSNIVYSTPDTVNERLSRVAGAPVALDTEGPVAISNRKVDAVNSSELLTNAPAILKGIAAQHRDGKISDKTAEGLSVLPPELVQGVAAVESGGVSKAVSGTNVHGLMQVTKATAKSYGLNREIPEENVLAGALFLTDMMSRYNGNLRYALTAYSAAGPGAVSDAIANAPSGEWADVKAELKKSLSPDRYAQAANYADNVLAYTTQFMGNNAQHDQALLWAMQRSGVIKPGNSLYHPATAQESKPLVDALKSKQAKGSSSSSSSSNTPESGVDSNGAPLDDQEEENHIDVNPNTDQVKA